MPTSLFYKRVIGEDFSSNIDIYFQTQNKSKIGIFSTKILLCDVKKYIIFLVICLCRRKQRGKTREIVKTQESKILEINNGIITKRLGI